MSKKDFLKKIVKESMDEIVSGAESFHDFKHMALNQKSITDRGRNFNPEASSHIAFVYHGTPSSFEQMTSTGAQTAKDFRNGQCHGRGIYAMTRLKDVSHGNSVVKYAVKPGTFDNFILFYDSYNNVREFLFSKGWLSRRNESIRDNIHRLLGDEMFNWFDSQREKHYYRYETMTDSEFRQIMTQGEKKLDQNRIDGTQVEGWSYNYGGTGLIFISSDTLIPYKFYTPEEKRAIINGRETEDSCGRYAIKDKEHFDRLNYNVDAFKRAHTEYPDTDEKLNSIKGFALVRRGNQYNLINNITGKLVSPAPMEWCSGFNPIEGGAQFTLAGTRFSLDSNDYGRTLEFTVYPNGYNKAGIPLTQEQFVQMATQYNEYLKSNGKRYQKSQIAESFMDGSYDDYINKVVPNTVTIKGTSRYSDEEVKRFTEGLRNGKYPIFYTCSEPKNKDSMMQNGATYEFTGTGSDTTTFQGVVAYGALSFGAAKHNMEINYGEAIYRFVLNDDFSKYIIFDPKLLRIMDPSHRSCYDQVVDLFKGKTYKGKSLYSIVDENLKEKHRPGGVNGHIHYEGLAGLKHLNPDSQGDIAHSFFQACAGKQTMNLNRAKVWDENILNIAGVRGFIYNGGNHWDCICVRNFNALMPLGYVVNQSGDYHRPSFKRDSHGNIVWENNSFMNEELFNKLNDNVTARAQYGGEYPKTSLMAKQSQGYVVVEGDNGYNYMNVRTHKRLLPVDVDKASSFNIMEANAQFQLLGLTWTINKDNNESLKLMCKGQIIPVQAFIKMLYQAKAAGALGNKQIYDDCCLNDNANQLNEGVKKTKNETVADKMRHFVDECDNIFTNENENPFVSDNAKNAVYKCANTYDNLSSSDRKKYLNQVIYVILSNPDNYLKWFKDEDGASFFWSRTVKDVLPTCFPNFNPSENMYCVKAMEFHKPELERRVEMAKANKENNMSDAEKIMKQREENKRNRFNTQYNENELDAYNFYTNVKCEFPTQIDWSLPHSQINAVLMPYFEKEPQYKTYEEIKNLCNQASEQHKYPFVFDGVSVTTPFINGTKYDTKSLQVKELAKSLGPIISGLRKELINMGLQVGTMSFNNYNGVESLYFNVYL